MSALVQAGLQLQANGNHAEVITLFQHLIATGDQQSDYYSLLALSLEATDKIEQAIETMQQVLTLEPNNAYFLAYLAKLYQVQGEHEMACHYFSKAIHFNPNSAQYFTTYSLSLLELNRFDECESMLQAALLLDPHYEAALNTFAQLWYVRNDYKNSIHYYLLALSRNPTNPELHFNLSTVYLRMKDFENGFAEYTWRWQTHALARSNHHSVCRWHGENLNQKKIVITYEQGFGDFIQFSRYVPLIKQYFPQASVSLAIPESLLKLFNTLLNVDYYIEKSSIQLQEFDYHCALLDLPRPLKTTFATIPPVPKLALQPESISGWAANLAAYSSPKVGICWSGNALNPIDKHRACPLENFALLFSLTATFINLNKAASVDEKKFLKNFSNTVDFTEQLIDYHETAALVKNLDCIITTDTSIAHLAGTLNCPTYLLIGLRPDWRWFDGETSPWYSSVRLIRRLENESWMQLIQRTTSLLTTHFNKSQYNGS